MMKYFPMMSLFGMMVYQSEIYFVANYILNFALFELRLVNIYSVYNTHSWCTL